MILVIKDTTVLYSQVTESKVEAIKISNVLFGMVPTVVAEPQAIKFEDKAYLIAFSAEIPDYLHVMDEFKNAQILILDDFEGYGEKVRSYYASFTKEELFQELLKYRILEVTDGDASTII